MLKTLILTPNKNEMCGMYQLAKDLAKEFDGEIITKKEVKLLKNYREYLNRPKAKIYDTIITFLYPT